MLSEAIGFALKSFRSNRDACVGVGSSDHGAGEEGRVVSHFGALGSGVGEIKAVGVAVEVSIRVWVGFAFVGS